jgi:CDP-diacylglycerol--glycerol-3-phosphate 3-phosphatidyltransferase
MNLPTWITVSRLIGIPIIFVALQSPTANHRWLAMIVFVVAAGTDWLDGYLARRLQQVTDLGKFLDPLVDKLLVLAPLIALVGLNQIPAWGVFLILARELTIAGWRVSPTMQGNQVPGANLWGKVKTVVQMVAIAGLLSPLALTIPTLALALFWLSVVLTWVSGLIYLWP